jgi:hypothetical protein
LVPSEPRSPHRSSKSRKRDSVLLRVAEAGSVKLRPVLLTNTLPPHDDIKLTVLSLPALEVFLLKFNTYQVVNGTSLKLSSLLSAAICDHLVASCRRGLDLVALHKMKTKELLKLLLKQVRPRSRMEFRTILVDTCPFDLPAGYVPSTTDFKPFYAAFLAFSERFLRTYEICAEGNSKNIPHLGGKENSVVKIFLGQIPFGYGNALSEKLRSKKPHSIYGFLRSVNKILQKHYRAHLRVELVDGHFAGADSISSDEEGDGLDLVVIQPTQIRTRPAAKMNPVTACLLMLFEGSCSREHCTFSHDSRILAAQWLETMEKLRNSKFRPNRNGLSEIRRHRVGAF